MATDAFHHEAFAPIRPWAARTDPRARGRLDLDALNRFAVERALRTEDGLAVRFVDSRGVDARCNIGAQPRAYETVIGETGAVPTRIEGAGMLHDWLNALSWLAFPRVKARVNRLHCDAISDGAAGSQRGSLRDAATLFDESGAVFFCGDATSADALRRADWASLFVEGRERFAHDVGVALVGHSIFAKLLSPYKSICAHAWIVSPWRAAQACDSMTGFDALDAAVAAQLDPATLRASMLPPLPLAGVPGWWPQNADASWYDDPKVFRSRR